jgi:putative tricarboxylic transport membrane protein
MDERGSDSIPRSLVGPRIVAAILVLGGAFLIYASLSIRQPAGFSAVGPSAIPLVVSIGLVVLGLLLAVRTTLRLDADYGEEVAREERTTHWPTVGLLMLALVVYALALNGFRLGPLAVPGAGYIIATGLFVPAAARVLGSRHLVRDVITGFGIAVAVYVGFTQYLGVRLPAGPLDLFG